jgi:hypothetical protein
MRIEAADPSGSRHRAALRRNTVSAIANYRALAFIVSQTPKLPVVRLHRFGVEPARLQRDARLRALAEVLGRKKRRLAWLYLDTKHVAVEADAQALRRAVGQQGGESATGMSSHSVSGLVAGAAAGASVAGAEARFTARFPLDETGVGGAPLPALLSLRLPPRNLSSKARTSVA